MNKNSIVGSPKEIKGEAKESIVKATGDAKRRGADEKTDPAEDNASKDTGGTDDAVRDALAVSAAAMTLGGIH
jgi:uncharacterized protein YjbJ (UPF0337 family)